MLLFGVWVTATLPPGGGNWNPEAVAAIWLFAIFVSSVMQAIATLIAMFRRRAASKVAAAAT